MSGSDNSYALDRLRKFCAYQERCHSEVRTKLIKMEVYGDKLEEVMSQLISEDFLNEERYARSYARGKFRMNKWGRFKIRLHLQQKQVSDYCIEKGLAEIEEEAYIEVIDQLLETKLRGKTDFASRQKAKASLIRKGFEPELVGQRLAAQPHS